MRGVNGAGARAEDARAEVPQVLPGDGLGEAETERFLWRRAALITQTTLGFAVMGIVTALVSILHPGVLSGPGRAVSIALMAALLASHLMLARRPSVYWVVMTYCVGSSLVLAIADDPYSELHLPSVTAIIAIAGWGLGSVATQLVYTRGKMVLLGVLFVLTMMLFWHTLAPLRSEALSPLALIVGCWAVSVAFGLWISRTFPRISHRLVAIGRADRLERRASHEEARRHRDARLLHDTALATLTLLAHGGRGVAEPALRAQAGADRDLLARLREGEEVRPESSADYSLTTREAGAATGALARTRERLAGLGLEVDWHGLAGPGGGGVDPAVFEACPAGEALVLAISECLENVRRHAGVARADVTLSADGERLRAVVTDSGSGFDPAAIPAGKLGFRESVEGRIHAVGGSVRVFSAPGAGTTVMLEVPREGTPREGATP